MTTTTAPTFLPYPEQFTPQSIVDMLPIGQTRDGAPIGPRLREGGAFIFGQLGSGTSALRCALTAGLLQCTDALVWDTDPRGISDLRLFGDAIDWTARTVDEMRAMVSTAAKIALERKRGAHEWRMALNTNVMPVGTGADGEAPPAIVLMLNERDLDLLKGDRSAYVEVRRDLEWIHDLSRDSAVTVVIEAKRATVDHADTMARANTPNRIGMRVTDATELAFGFGRYDLDPAETCRSGDGFITTGEWLGDVVPFRGLLIRPHTMRSIGEQAKAASVRPVLEAHSQLLAGDAYADRK